MNVAVVTVVLTGADASQRATSADATDGMASSRVATMMNYLSISFSFVLGNDRDRRIPASVPSPRLAR